MTRPRLPLRVLLPAIFLGVGLVGATLAVLATLSMSSRHLERLSGEYLMNVGHAYASDLQASLRNRDLDARKLQPPDKIATIGRDKAQPTEGVSLNGHASETVKKEAPVKTHKAMKTIMYLPTPP